MEAVRKRALIASGVLLTFILLAFNLRIYWLFKEQRTDIAALYQQEEKILTLDNDLRQQEKAIDSLKGKLDTSQTDINNLLIIHQEQQQLTNRIQDVLAGESAKNDSSISSINALKTDVQTLKKDLADLSLVIETKNKDVKNDIKIILKEMHTINGIDLHNKIIRLQAKVVELENKTASFTDASSSADNSSKTHFQISDFENK